MRIIAGEYRSRRLSAPSGLRTRPTLERTRESLFSMLMPLLSGARVLDLFAGSGALGLEALSRGAATAVFCDSSRDAIRALRENFTALQTQDRARLLPVDYRRALNTLKEEGAAFDLIFLDPPYDMPATAILQALEADWVLAQGGMMLLEQDRRADLVLPDAFALQRSKTYGDTRIDFIVASREV